MKSIVTGKHDPTFCLHLDYCEKVFSIERNSKEE